MPGEQQREQITKESIQAAFSELAVCVEDRLEEHGFGTFASRHEALGRASEEWDEFRLATGHEPIERVKAEALDLAVALIFEVACINQGTMFEEEKHRPKPRFLGEDNG